MIYQVPQFINEEVKIMGIITFTQLWLLLGSIGFIAFLFFVLPHWLFFILFLFLAPGSLLMIFGQSSGIPLYKVIFAAIRHAWLPKYYLWKKNTITTSINSINPEEEQAPSISSKETNPSQKNISPELLDKLTNILDK